MSIQITGVLTRLRELEGTGSVSASEAADAIERLVTQRDSAEARTAATEMRLREMTLRAHRFSEHVQSTALQRACESKTAEQGGKAASQAMSAEAAAKLEALRTDIDKAQEVLRSRWNRKLKLSMLATILSHAANHSGEMNLEEGKRDD